MKKEKLKVNKYYKQLWLQLNDTYMLNKYNKVDLYHDNE